MNNFINICKMTQAEVKEYMKQYLTELNYEVIDEDGFLYAKGDVPVLLVAHMDTVHKQQCDIINLNNGRISSPQGIGGDDRCGIYLISRIVKEKHCSVLLCEEEEKGAIGAKKFIKTDYINNLDVNYMVELDRRGNCDAVFYSCDNAEFTDFVLDATGFEEAHGSFTDISELMPASKIAGVNLSSGYYNAHHIDEYVIMSDMETTLDAAMILIESKCDEPFEYVAKKCKWTRPASTYMPSKYQYQFNFFNDYPTMSPAEVELENTDIELEVLVPDEMEIEKAIYVSGKTKAECWMKFFLQNPEYSFNDINAHSWS